MIKRIIFVFLSVFFLCCVTVRADSFATYDGNLSSSALTYFRDVDIPFWSDYVVFRDGDYSYKMFVSDTLKTNGSGFVAESGTLYNWFTSGNFNNTQHYTHNDIQSFVLTNNNHYIVYSSLGTYARLERGLDYEKIKLFVFLTACIFVLIGIIFKSITIMPFGSSRK